MSYSDREENFNQIDFIFEYEQYSNKLIDNQNHYQTDFKQEQPQITIQRFQTLMLNEANTKNIPKTFGNNFKKFMDNLISRNDDLIGRTQISQCMNVFLNKKSKGQQSNYILQDFKTLFSNKICSKWLQFYIENCAFLDLIHSPRIENVEEYILFIEQYLAGARDPDNFISNRQLKKKKEDIKKQMMKEKQDEFFQEQDSNIQFVGQNYDQFSNNHNIDKESELVISAYQSIGQKL
ncbi:unnamed protein product [Paramecium sonneborni]|uniref:Uncharacterized protein n=1 Tax=Paramecium sonneborni TaxID=65129 RepID=A0A8S1M7D5_9CILI|nr:unnamed protein product [Paramecium sonneborni]